MRNIFTPLTVFLIFLTAPLTQARVFFLGVPLYLPEILLLGWTLILTFTQQRITFSKPLKVLAFFQVILLIGILTSALHTMDPHGFGIIKSWFLFPFLLFWLITLWAATPKDRFSIILGWNGALSAIAILALWFWLRSDISYDGRLSAIFPSPNHLALFLFPAPLLSTYLFFQNNNSFRMKLFSGLAFLLSIFILTQTYSYTAWISLFFAFLIFYLLEYQTVSKVMLWKTILIISGALIIFLATQYDNPKLTNWVQTPDRSSLASRITIWESAALMIKHHPFLGIGPGMFQKTYLDYQVFFPPYLEWAAPEPHNLLLAFWLESGAIGLIGFLGLVIWWFRFLWKNWRLADASQRNDLRLVISLFIGILIQGVFDTPYWKTDLAYTFWIILALGIQILAKSSQRSLKDQSSNKA